MVWSRWVSFDKTWLSDQEIFDYRRQATTLAAVAGWTSAQQNLTGDGEPERVSVGQVTANTFDVLGAVPVIGRAQRGRRRARARGPPGRQSGSGRATRAAPAPAAATTPRARGRAGRPPRLTEEAADPPALRALQLDEANAQRAHCAAAVLAPGATAAAASEELRALTSAMTRQGPIRRRCGPAATALDDEVRGGARRVARRRLLSPRERPGVRGDGAEGRWGALGRATTERLARQLLTERGGPAPPSARTRGRWRARGGSRRARPGPRRGAGAARRARRGRGRPWPSCWSSAPG